MAARRSGRFVKLCEERPADQSKRGRDLGTYLRQRVAQAFREGENTQMAEPEACDQMHESLARLHSNYYKHKYPRPRDTSFSGLSVEEHKLILSTDTLEESTEMNKGMWKKLQKTFAPRNTEEKQKAWARLGPCLAGTPKCGVLYVAIINKTVLIPHPHPKMEDFEWKIEVYMGDGEHAVTNLS